MKVFEWIDRDKGVITAWLDLKKGEDALDKKRLGRFYGYLRSLAQYGHAKSRGLGWYGEAGSDGSELPRIKLNGDVAFRVFFCEGPVNKATDAEITMTAWSTKRDNQNDWSTAPTEALARAKGITKEEHRLPFPIGEEQ